MTGPQDTQSSLASIDRKLRELQEELARVFDPSAFPEPSATPPPPTEPAPPAAQSPPAFEPSPAPWSAQTSAPGQPRGYADPAVQAFEGAAGARAPEPQPVQAPPREPGTAAGTAYDRPPSTSLIDEALARVSEIGRHVVEIQRLHDELVRATKELALHYRRFTEPPIRHAAPPVAAQFATGPAAQPSPSPPRASGGDIDPADARSRFSGVVMINAGPFFDIATLSELQDGLRAVPGVDDAAVRSFDGDRALIDVRLGAPTPVVDELRRVLRFGFSVVAQAQDLITINLDHVGG